MLVDVSPNWFVHSSEPRWTDIYALRVKAQVLGSHVRANDCPPRLMYTRQETSEHLLAAILNLSARDSPTGHGAVNGGVNFAEQTSQDILEVQYRQCRLVSTKKS